MRPPILLATALLGLAMLTGGLVEQGEFLAAAIAGGGFLFLAVRTLREEPHR